MDRKGRANASKFANEPGNPLRNDELWQGLSCRSALQATSKIRCVCPARKGCFPMKLDHFNRIRTDRCYLARSDSTLSLARQLLRDSVGICLGIVQAALRSCLFVLSAQFLTKLTGLFKKSTRLQKHPSYQSMLHMRVISTGTIFSLRWMLPRSIGLSQA